LTKKQVVGSRSKSKGRKRQDMTIQAFSVRGETRRWGTVNERGANDTEKINRLRHQSFSLLAGKK